MKRPPIKDKAILAYVEYLESQVNSSATKKKFYKGIQRQLDLIADELLSDEFKITLKGIEGEKNENFDRFFDMLTKGSAIVTSMKNFENEVYQKEEEKKISQGTADEFINS